MKKTTIITMICLMSAMTMFSQEYIDITKKKQRIEGWGVSLCWWARMCGSWDDKHIDEIVDWLVSPDGLNYNIFRYNIGGGDDPQNRNCEAHHMGKGKGLRAEMPGFKAYADSPYDWSADSAQTKIMLKIRERRPDAIFEAFSNSAPWYMTISGCCSGYSDGGKDNLRPDCYEEFADYLVDVCKHYKDTYGITFRTLEPFNESLSNYWCRSGSQEGCHFDIDTQVAVIKHVYAKLAKAKLKTVISASDETSVRHSLDAFDGYGDALKIIGQWNTHTYSATSTERYELAHKAASHGIRLWMSETGSGGNGITGNLNMLQRLIDDVRQMEAEAWCDWQYIEEKGDQWCLVNGNFKTQQYSKVKNYYVRQQVTRFIKQGYYILDNDKQEMLSAVSPDGKTLVVVIVNNTDAALTSSIVLPQVAQNVISYTTSQQESMKENLEGVNTNNIKVHLLPKSVKTYVFSL